MYLKTSPNAFNRKFQTKVMLTTFTWIILIYLIETDYQDSTELIIWIGLIMVYLF